METKIIKLIHFSLFSSQNTTYEYNGFPGGARGKESTSQYRRHRDMGLIPGLGRSPEEGKWQPTPVFLPGKFHGQRSMVGYSP